MKKSILVKIILLLLIAIFIMRCSPKETSTGTAELSASSKSWIPFYGTESVVFKNDTNIAVYTGTGREDYFENVRYMSDQSGFITMQEDYYAELERNSIIFESSSSPYFFSYYLEKNKGETGEWDMLHVTIADGDYYKNQIKLVVFETDEFNKGEIYKFQATKNLNGHVFDSVYFWTQKQRPFELYYTKSLGIIAYKASSNKLWVIVTDSTSAIK
ncbi:MAG: hypothetical protein R2750_01510 [Bacteroidales bacterium]